MKKSKKTKKSVKKANKPRAKKAPVKKALKKPPVKRTNAAVDTWTPPGMAPVERPTPPEPARARVKSRGPLKDPTSEAARKFLGSMNITYEMWHEGEGYDLDALREVPEEERETLETILIEHSPRDWRDIDALAVLDSRRAREVITEAQSDGDAKVRRLAQEAAPKKLDKAAREKLLIEALKTAAPYAGLTEALDEIEELHPPAVIDALFRGALEREPEAAVHYAAMLFYLHGKAKEQFDWDHRPFFLKFHSTGDERREVFEELCKTCGVDPAKYLG